ncbi:MAG TPA: ParB N-terminal domain-containing protein [Roseomonas sp.]
MREDRVAALMESIGRLGLLTPIAVRTVAEYDIPGEGLLSGVPLLVAGGHRLEACKRLGMEFVPAIRFTDETEARLWEISENLHRADLTALEWSEQVAEWIRLTDAKGKLAQVAPVSPSGGRGNEGGIRAASREIGVDRDAARRAVKIDSIAPEAKAIAADAGFADNQSALLKIAKAEPADQVAAAERLRAEKAARALAEQEAREKRQGNAAADAFAEWLSRHAAPALWRWTFCGLSLNGALMAAKKARFPIPTALADELLYASDRTCCVCEERGRPIQIHHIDERPSNNAAENLAVLCLPCHEQTQIRGGFGRKLSAGQVVLYRNGWIERVYQRRLDVDALFVKHKLGLT